MKITAAQAEKMILATNGKIFGVRFQKRTDNKIRTMSARLGVKKGLTGAGQKYDPKAKDLITVFSMDAKGYRSIPLDGLLNVTIDGEDYIVQ